MAKRAKKLYEMHVSWSDRLAMRIAAFTGNMVFVWIHVVIFAAWIAFNIIASHNAWDPYPFIFLTLLVSLEAIFLSTFVLIAQNREAEKNEIREQLDYEVNVKAEQEIQEIKISIEEILALLKKGK